MPLALDLTSGYHEILFSFFRIEIHDIKKKKNSGKSKHFLFVGQ